MPENTDRIDPENNTNPLAKGDTNSTKNPTEDSAGEVGAEGSKGVLEIGEVGRPRDKDAA